MYFELKEIFKFLFFILLVLIFFLIVLILGEVDESLINLLFVFNLIILFLFLCVNKDVWLIVW